MQKAFDKQAKLLIQDLRHPGLRAKKYDEARDTWQARVTRDWRFYFSIEGDTYNLHTIMPTRSSQTISSQAFVAMWFDESLKAVYRNGFEPALRQTGYTPIRLDLEEHNEKICDRVLSQIRKSGLLVADVTNQRASVLFEAGFALGLGIPVIWTCRSGDEPALPFDTRQYNHIFWNDSEDLREKLALRIEATIPRIEIRPRLDLIADNFLAQLTRLTPTIPGRTSVSNNRRSLTVKIASQPSPG